MSYEFLSPNIITRENFLSEQEVTNLYTDILGNEQRFVQSEWSNTRRQSSTRQCKGDDIWITPENSASTPSIWGLQKHFFSTEFQEFISKHKTVFSFLAGSKISFLAHCVAYRAGGSYDRHMDQYLNRNGTMVKNFFTFNLTLHRKGDLRGGEAVLYDPDKIVIDQIHNRLTIFPSYIYHSVNTVLSDGEVPFEDRRFSIQFWCSLI